MNLIFSDSVKFAQAALNLSKGNGFKITHSFFNPSPLSSVNPVLTFPANFLPLPSWLLSLLFRFFPATDLNIALFGLVFFFLSALLVFYIGKKLYSNKAGLIASLFFPSSLFFQEYALNFSSETIFIFLILLFTYLLLLPKKLKIISLIPLGLMFLTRQQAPVFLGSLLITSFLVFLFSKIEKKKKTFVLLGLFLFTTLSLFIGYLTMTFKFPN